MSHQFLFELGTEELPPTALLTLSTAFEASIKQQLDTAKIGYNALTSYATPRRLAIVIDGLDETTPIEAITNWGPPAKIAVDKDGNPSKAAMAFAKKNGLDVADLQTENDGKADKLVAHIKVGGDPVKALLPATVQTALSALPIAKRMRWGSSRAEFVRPVQWVVMLLDNDVLPATILDIDSGRTTRGHRFHANHTITLNNPAEYATALKEQGHIMPSFSERQSVIKQQVQEQAHNIGGEAVIGQDLLDEVTGLVEWPVALSGKFDETFLSVPSEALVSSMKEHQKYFHVVDKSGELIPYFITVANIVSRDPAQVIDGNERVIRPRLADAAFFFDTDKKVTLASRVDKLKSVVFQAKLGTVYDKTIRLEQLADYVCQQTNTPATDAKRACVLSKCDLISNMVVEFSGMQGLAGYHYALNDGENAPVAQAIGEQYKPKFAGDTLPQSHEGTVLALADRLDTITGIFGIGQVPSGSKDPFALRRASLGLLRLIIENNLTLDLRDLVSKSASLFSDLPKKETVVDDVTAYILERFKSWYSDANIAIEVYQAVEAKKLTVPLDINDRVYAVNAFSALPEAQALAAANKRVSNILAKQADDVATSINTALFESEAESALYNQVQALQVDIAPLLAQKDYTQTLKTLASLRAAIDTFFDDVMVLTDDMAIRHNRLALLKQLQTVFLHVADISCLAVK